VKRVYAISVIDEWPHNEATALRGPVIRTTTINFPMTLFA
jgi:hypothetical protein